MRTRLKSSSNAGICRSDAAFIFLAWLINRIKYITCNWTYHDNKLTTIGSATILFKDRVFPRINATPSTLWLGRTPRTSGPEIKSERYDGYQHNLTSHPMTKRRKQPMSPRVKNSSLTTINISKHRKPSYRYITSTERNQRLRIVRGMAIDLPSFFFHRPNLMILQVWSLWVNLLPILLFHITMIISKCYLENCIKVKDLSRPLPFTHRLLSHKHGNILETQICFQLTETDTIIHKASVRQW